MIMLQKPLIKKRALTLEKKREAHYTRIFIFFLIIYLVYYLFQPRLLGTDWRYDVFIFWLPLLTGFFMLAAYFQKIIYSYLRSTKMGVSKILLLLLFTGQGLVFSYISFGMVADMAWKLINRQVASNHSTEYVDCPITKFRSAGSRSGNHPGKIYFMFHDQPSSLEAIPERTDQYKNEDPKNLVIRISARKGIWNLYTVDDWEIKYAGK